MLPDFRLETYFSRWEFNARYHMTASDMETLSMQELLDMADDDARQAWDSLRLGYTETFGRPTLRQVFKRQWPSGYKPWSDGSASLRSSLSQAAAPRTSDS